MVRILGQSQFQDWENHFFVDLKLLTSSVKWLLQYQKRDGSFIETDGYPVPLDRRLMVITVNWCLCLTFTSFYRINLLRYPITRPLKGASLLMFSYPSMLVVIASKDPLNWPPLPLKLEPPGKMTAHLYLITYYPIIHFSFITVISKEYWIFYQIRMKCQS